MDYETKFRRLILTALNHKATDIHITGKDGRYSLELRTMQELISLDRPVMTDGFIEFLRFRANLDLFSAFKPQTGRIEIILSEVKYFIRLASLKNRRLDTIVLRILNPPTILTLEKLFPNEGDRKNIEKLLKLKSGLILFTGSTGSGKSTTLYTCLKSLDSQKIYSIEDPIEFQYDHIVQMEVNPHQGFHFEDAIKQVLRHDPNIIVIGEIRDPQEANAAFRCSLSGHLVLSTLHTNGLQKTLTRLIEFGIPKDLINQSLNAILYQELDYDTKTDKKSAKIEILNNADHSICP